MNRRALAVLFALALVPSFASMARAQETRVPPEPSRKATKRLAFTTPPAWKARPPEGRPWVCDYDLEGGCRVNVLYYPVDVATFEERLPHRWRKADGTPHAKDELIRETLSLGGLTANVVDLSGTFTPAEGAPATGQRLVAVRLDVAGGAFTAWLFGPEAEVAKHRARYLEWLGTVRVSDREAAAAPAGDGPIAETRFVHGAPEHGVPGPWALTGHRIGRNALERFGVTRERSWELLVTHRSPREVRYTCMLDGLLASTGCSPGKLNLVLESAADEEHMSTVVVHRPTKRTLTYRLKKTFRDSIRETAYADFPKAAQQLEGTKDEDLFEVTEGKLEDAPARATRTLMLDALGESKIMAIKVVREITGLGLKDAKDLVESKLPVKVKDGLSPEDAESAKKKLEAVGARASIE